MRRLAQSSLSRCRWSRGKLKANNPSLDGVLEASMLDASVETPDLNPRWQVFDFNYIHHWDVQIQKR